MHPHFKNRHLNWQRHTLKTLVIEVATFKRTVANFRWKRYEWSKFQFCNKIT